MVVAVIAVRVVEVAIDQVIDMITMGDRLMPAARAVGMVGSMAATLVAGGATVGILAVGFQCVFIDMVAMYVMQVPVVQVIDMPIVLDCSVAAAGFVLMVMVGMLVAGTHFERL
ncbi:hypothetical protein [Pseudomonas putida]|uniref:hypothetical protein n=1 Tax=Pseudomonas putida TaxID=303 RepID=UPI001F516A8D|nr:hypothetical protein [Pseudomonas putida]MCI0915157.1 hypothetical protein [Pseudomonas putida]